jgi:hypothetical protein
VLGHDAIARSERSRPLLDESVGEDELTALREHV